MSRKDNMLAELNEITTYFMSVVQKKSKYSLFLFFEGKDDSKYYYSRVSNIFGDILYDPICCGGKSNLIKIHELIKHQTSMDNIATLYFVDRDYDDNSNLDCDIYVTPTYSIENLYFTDKAISNMLKVELGISSHSSDDLYDFAVAFSFLKNKRDALINDILYANAVYSLQIIKASGLGIRVPNMNAINNCKDIMKISELAQLKNKITDYIELTEDEINEELIRLRSDAINLIRGKYLLEMMPIYINSLFKEYNAGTFKKKRKNTLNICECRILSNLSQYAETPECLVKYIEERYRQYHH